MEGTKSQFLDAMTNNSIMQNASSLLAAKLIARALGLLSTLIVARILSPDDYGIIAVAMIVQELAMRLQSIGFAANVISSSDDSDEFYSSVFLGKILLCLLLSLSIFFSSDYLADLLNSADSAVALKIIAWVLVIESCANFNLVLCSKEKNFRPSIYSQVGAKLISVVSTIALAIWLGNYLALAIGMVIAAVAQLGLSYVFAPPRVPLKLSFTGILKVYRYGFWYFATQMGDFLNAKLGHIFVGRYFGAATLGHLAMASSLSSIYYSVICSSVDKANLSQVVEDIHSKTGDKQYAGTIIRANMSYIFKIKDILILPVHTVFIVFSDLIISMLLGPNWTSTAPMFSIICLAAIVSAYTGTYTTLISALREPQYLSYCMLIRLAGVIASVLIGYQTENIYYMLIGNVCTGLAIYLYLNYIFHTRFQVNLMVTNLQSTLQLFGSLCAAYLFYQVFQTDSVALICYAGTLASYLVMRAYLFQDQVLLEMYEHARLFLTRKSKHA
ncbi:hypothetical protein EYC98_10580 [Halieaceae bacterium IMCC14734]|uniref:Polysaccharide biosynthesis protein n=1 Tax=Candidatus Litorirhabdus singularis TaxID=2518993 RepID=A0ABT3TGA8_9GAMM|nr:oligosaccharide flippase family protein [Candidatus Litorirhabdus singularis]MCX2981309.1 hypothetical protein [Candidatus Litorirhabdus singularis]